MCDTLLLMRRQPGSCLIIISCNSPITNGPGTGPPTWAELLFVSGIVRARRKGHPHAPVPTHFQPCIAAFSPTLCRTWNNKAGHASTAFTKALSCIGNTPRRGYTRVQSVSRWIFSPPSSLSRSTSACEGELERKSWLFWLAQEPQLPRRRRLDRCEGPMALVHRRQITYPQALLNKLPI